MVMVGNEGREELEMATGSAEQQRPQRTVKLEDLSLQECGASVPPLDFVRVIHGHLLRLLNY